MGVCSLGLKLLWTLEAAPSLPATLFAQDVSRFPEPRGTSKGSEEATSKLVMDWVTLILLSQRTEQKWGSEVVGQGPTHLLTLGVTQT